MNRRKSLFFAPCDPHGNAIRSRPLFSSGKTASPVLVPDTASGAPARSTGATGFSVNLSDDVYCCFDGRCDKQGDVIDLWSALKQMSLRESALDLVRTFDLEPAPARATEKRHG